MSEKTSAELFAEEVEIGKQLVDDQNHLAEVKREILNLRKKIDELRKEIRDKENEVLDWEKAIRGRRQLKTEKHNEAWTVRQSGL